MSASKVTPDGPLSPGITAVWLDPGIVSQIVPTITAASSRTNTPIAASKRAMPRMMERIIAKVTGLTPDGK